MSAMDLDSSAAETGSLASGDDVNGSVSSSFLTPLGKINDHLGDSLFRDDSASSVVEDAIEEHKQGWNDSHYFIFSVFVVFF